MSFAPDFSPDRRSNTPRPKAWGKAFLQFSLHTHTLLGPRDFRLLSGSWRINGQCTSLCIWSHGCWNASRAFFLCLPERNTILWERMHFLQVREALRGMALAISRKSLEVQRFGSHLISFSGWWNEAPHLWASGSCTACKAKPRRVVLFWSPGWAKCFLFVTSGDPVENLPALQEFNHPEFRSPPLRIHKRCPWCR